MIGAASSPRDTGQVSQDAGSSSEDHRAIQGPSTGSEATFGSSTGSDCSEGCMPNMLISRVSEQVFDSNGDSMEAVSSGAYFLPDVMQHVDSVVRLGDTEYYVIPNPPRKAERTHGV